MSLRKYFLSRSLIAVIFGLMFIFLGATWWIGLFAGLLALAVFIWAPRSGRYVRQIQKNGQIKLAHDENTRAIADKAARNGFVICIITLAGLALYFWKSGIETISMNYLYAVLWAGLLTFTVSDLMMRRFGKGWPSKEE
jgi:hypothetical protein